MTVSRRYTLQTILAAAATMSVPTGAAFAGSESGRRAIPWKNWAGNQSCLPALKATPKGLDELISVVKSSPSLRVVGSGHSWSALVPTDGTLLSLRRLTGLIDYDSATSTAKIAGGTKLSHIGPMLDDIGQAMTNMPDIDAQTLAGALSTGTHGTGLALPALHDTVEALTLVTANGDVLECSRTQHADLFDAARVSFGALGVITDYTLKNPASYRVEKKSWLEGIESVLERQTQLSEENRCFEFFYIPFSDSCYCMSTNITDKATTALPEEGTEQDALDDMKKVRDIMGFSPTARRLFTKGVLKLADIPEPFVVQPWQAISNVQSLPIFEMEYQIPLEFGPAALREIIEYLESNHPEFFVPIEYRYVDSDDAWMSQFYGRKSVSISVHRYREGTDPWKIFGPVSDILRKYEGRPHWGKMHNLSYEELKPLYPKMDDFRRVRAELDPEGKFLNDHLRTLLAIPA